MKNQPSKLIQVLLIDPYKKELRKAEIGADLDTWYKLLRCDCVDCRRLISDGEYCLDIWFDDEFLCKEPPGPFFQIGDGERYAGYAFLANSNAEGDTISLAQPAIDFIPNDVLAKMLQLRWENYEKRFGPDAFLDLRMRTPELELPGYFKFLDICPDCGKVHS